MGVAGGRAGSGEGGAAGLRGASTGAPDGPFPGAGSGADAARTAAWLGFAGELADLARPIAARWFRRPLDVESKADASPVTRADREIEARLRARIAEHLPGHAVLGEEFGSEGEGRWRWVIDPIDGTRSFICGLPLFGTLVALLEDDRPIIGVIDMPMLDERWVAAVGQGPTRCNGEICQTSACRDLARARLFSTAPDLFQGEDRERIQGLERAVAVRRFGGDCYQYAMLASGHHDLVIEAGLQPYDVMALVPVIEGAGGLIRNWEGRPLSEGFDGRVVAAATAELLEASIEMLRK